MLPWHSQVCTPTISSQPLPIPWPPLPYSTLLHPPLLYPPLPYSTLLHPPLFCPTQPCRTLPYTTPSHPIAPCHHLPSPVAVYLPLPNPTLPSPTLSSPAARYPTLPYSPLPFHLLLPYMLQNKSNFLSYFNAIFLFTPLSLNVFFVSIWTLTSTHILSFSILLQLKALMRDRKGSDSLPFWRPYTFYFSWKYRYETSAFGSKADETWLHAQHLLH